MKKFIISSSTLQKVLHKLSFAISTKSVLPALSNIYCKVGDKSIEFIATDLEVSIHYKCECETYGEGFEFLLPYQLITKIVALNKQCPLTFSLEKKGIKIKGSNDEFKLESLEKTENFPKLQPVPKKISMDIGESIFEWLPVAVETVSKDENTKKPGLLKVLLELRSAQTTIASTDGSFMVFSYKIALSAPADDDLLLSPKVIKALEGFKEAKLSWTDKVFAFANDEITIIVTRPDCKFVNYRAIFPEDFKTNLTIDRNTLINTLEKCNINSDPFKRTVLSLKQKPDCVVFNANDDQMGININVEVFGNYTGEVTDIKICSDKMLKVVNQVEFENIELAIHHEKRAILLRATDDEGYLGLLMPIN